ncbi:MAG: trigger factor [bacterium]|nr:trigger factor [bacterium]
MKAKENAKIPTMQTQIEKLPKSTVKITVTIPQDQVKAEREKAVEAAVKKAKIDGFRPGQAPRHLVEPKLDQGELNGAVINKLVPEAFTAALKEHLLRPISDPRIEIKQFGEDQEMVFEAMIAERPEAKLGDYRQALQGIGGQATVVYGPDGQPLNGKKEEAADAKINQVMEIMLKTCQVEVPPLLVEQEVSKMMARIIDQTQSLGITVEQYLQATNKTPEDLKLDYSRIAEQNLKAEFILQEIAKREEVLVKEEEIMEAIKAAPDESARAEMEKPENKLYLLSVLQKSKTLQKLMDLASGKASSSEEKISDGK